MTVNDQRKTKAELMSELSKLRKRLSRMEKRSSSLKGVRESLRDTEALYHNLINNIPVGLFRNTPGPSGKFVMANPTIARMFGCERVEDFLNYSVVELYQDPNERKRFSEKLLSQGKVTNEELRLKRVDGSTLWGSVSAQGVTDEQGKIKFFDGIIEDITERKNAEKALQKSEEQFRALFERSRDALMILDRNGFRDCNRATLSLFGCASREDFISKHPSELSPPLQADGEDSLAAAQQRIETAFREGSCFFEWIHQRLDGNAFFANVLLSKYELGGKEVLQATVRDITENKRVEDELKGSRRRLEDIINFLPDATFVIDAGGRVTAWNRAIEEMTGIKAENILGQANYEHALPFYGERRPILIDLVLRPKEEIELKYAHLHRQGDVITGQGHITNLGGGDLFFVGSAIPLRDSAGKVVGAIETIRDVTERKRFEDELARAKDAAEAANRSKSSFLANMSHEIRTPMNAIIGMAEILADTELSDEQRSYAEIIISSAAALLNIINDILDFSKIEAGKMDLSPRPFDFRKLIEELGQLFAMRIDQKKIDLIVNYEPGAPEELIGDEIRLRQVLTNLIGNAAKFTLQGHILIEVSCRRRDEKDAVLRVRVEDTGIGIPEQAQKIIFDKFTQVDSSPRRRFEGTGLGLAITKQLIALMGGELGVESELGKGSAFFFTITLPLSREVKEQPKFSVSLSGLRVLVVDDNKVNRMVVRKQLTSWEMQVEESASPQGALRLMQDAARAGRPYQIALLDFQMPEMDGIQLVENIRKDRELDSTVLIMLFSVVHQSDLDQLQRLGLAACLTKPLRTKLLLETMSTVWSARINHQKINLISLHRPSFEDYLPDPSRPSPRFSSSRVLLAEDNIANQKVAAKLLQILGCSVEIASNGKEAIKLAAAGEFDLIFMDCQMPEVDGFEATAKIRELEQGKRHTPIIALTAYAMQGDRERCLQAGMDDHLTKPISRQRVQEALERFLPSKPEQPRLKMEKVLIATADENQQQLFSQALRKVFPGARIKSCAEGIRMASWLGSFLPDLLVLDAAIPNVNSAAVVRHLRREERFAKTKILVLAAPEDLNSPAHREILALGVDGIINQPFSPERVEELLRQLAGAKPGMTGPGAETGRPAPSEPSPRPAEAVAEDALPIIDYAVLDNITGGDLKFAEEILGHYQESLPSDVNKIQEALAANDVLRVERSAHGVKGAAANVGAKRLQTLSGRIEAAARQGKLPECRELAGNLSPRLEEFIREIEKNRNKS